MSWIARPACRILDLNQALVTHPGQADLFKARAAEYHRLQNYVQAVADYSSSLVIQPEDAAALHLRGVAYEQLRQFDRARADYQRAINVDPQLADVYINRGITFGQAGNFRQSIASLTDGIRLAPQNPNGYFNRGITYFQQGDLARAIEDLSMVIQLIPNDEAAYYWRGISHEEARQQEEAIADYRQFLALSQDPDAIQEIEERMSRLNTGEREHEARGKPVPTDRGQMDQVPSAEAVQQIDLYDLIVALGERALDSLWLGHDVQCDGEMAEELYAYTDQDRPIQGAELLPIASGICQTIRGDFTVFDPNAASHWLYIHAWEGKGFYLETNDPQSRQRLKTHFQWIEEVEGASPPYEGLLLRL